MGISELQGQLFQLLDSRLGTFKTPFQARNYKKVILALQKSRILNTAEINVLFVKANRFLSKDSVKKEKTKIKNEVKASYITEGPGKAYLHSSDDDSEGGIGQEESKKPPKKVTAVKKGKASEDSSEYEDVSSSDSEEEKKPVNKRNAKEDPRNRVYLQHYRETVEAEQSERYTDVRTKHTVDFKSPKGIKKILEIEGLVRMIYKEQCVSTEDLQLRDKVLHNIKNAFKNCSDRDYPQLLTGELKISGFGSCQNGLWNVERSDIDVTCIV
jgi:hypothetical protein